MNKYDRLLLLISQQYNIYKGKQETENSWKMRLIYSICGMMAYASLWDNLEEPISIVHLKRRINRTLSNYQLMYPEISNISPQNSKILEDEIEDLFLKAGLVYKSPNKIAPSIKREELFENILFQRGISVDNISYVSGCGFYSKQEGTTSTSNIRSMFDLEQENLYTLWHKILSTASWKSNILFDNNIEYLRLQPPFSQGYWTNKPDTTSNISILRTGPDYYKVYYLYRYNGSILEVSQLPQWQVESYNYRALACACLYVYKTLPSINYYEDGDLVHIHMNYLLPPHELEFLKLYSWPETFTSLPCNFRRQLSKEIFTAIKNILSEQGYTFNGGIN